ncbi:hypothetical protein CPC08DRAFT_726696 [Agrocybe pediades]|nr:hypothetical protein CPC08DRAFT_726696 [Agrocybe pediades]
MCSSHSSKELLTVVLASLSLAAASFNDPIPLSPGFDVQAVLDQAVSLLTHSWEYGTESEALLNLYTPLYSKIVIAAAPSGLSDGDGAVGDSASLREYHGSAKPTWVMGMGVYGYGFPYPAYVAAAKAEPEANFFYMAPPFLTYYRAATHNAAFLCEGIKRITLYRNIFFANTTTGNASPPSSHPAKVAGLWTHILSQGWSESGIWVSGNGWAAAGFVHVPATLLKAPLSMFIFHPSPNLVNGILTTTWKQNSIRNIVKIVTGILDGAMRMPTNPNQGAKAIIATKGHIINGIATPTVNPLNWGDHKQFNTDSPEG